MHDTKLFVACLVLSQVNITLLTIRVILDHLPSIGLSLFKLIDEHIHQGLCVFELRSKSSSDNIVTAHHGFYQVARDVRMWLVR